MKSITLLVALLVLPVAADAAVPSYTVSGLSGMESSDSVVVSALSAGGPVGYSIHLNTASGGDAVYPLVWSGGQPEPLALPANSYGEAKAAAGPFIAGTVWPAALDPDNPQPNTYGQPAIWSGGQLKVLGTLNMPSGEALAVNGKGDAAGEVDNLGSASPVVQAVLWTGGQTLPLGSFPGQQATAVALNNSGQVLVEVAGTGVSSAYVWSSGSMSPIPALGASSISAKAINDAGQVVGGVEISPVTGGEAAFLYDGGITSPLAAEPEDAISCALAINNNGGVVGFGGSLGSGYHALLWEGGSVINLNTLIPANSGWYLSEATAISDDGIIMGEGVYNGQEMGFELTPSVSPSVATPEPASLAILALGATALLRRRRR